MDAVGKKIDFQRHIVRRLALKTFTALHGRIEALRDNPEYRSGFDLVTARALCSTEELLGLAEPFLAQGGCLVAMKGPEGVREFSALRGLLQQGGWSAVLHSLKLPVSGAERCLIELRK